MKEVSLEDNDNIHCVKFKLTFKPDDDDYDESYDETHFPDDDDVHGAIDNSLLDQANSYHVYLDSYSEKKVVFIIEVSNDETDEYLPNEGDIEHAMEYSGWIDEWNRFYASEVSRTVAKSVRRENKLTQLGI